MGDRRIAKEKYQLGAVFHDARDFESAMACYQEAVDADPDYEPVYNDMSVALSNLGRYKEALPILERAHRGRPDHVATLGNLFSCLYNLRRFSEARSYLDDAVSRGFQPKRDLPRTFVMHIAGIYWFTENQAEALPLFEWFLVEYPDNYMGRLGAGVCSYYLKQLERSLVHFKRALKADPDCSVVCLRIAQCYSDCSLAAMAVKYIRMAQDREPNIDLGPLQGLVS